MLARAIPPRASRHSYTGRAEEARVESLRRGVARPRREWIAFRRSHRIVEVAAEAWAERRSPPASIAARARAGAPPAPRPVRRPAAHFVSQLCRKAPHTGWYTAGWPPGLVA